MKLQREGVVGFEAEASGPGSGPGQAGGVFYNPAMAFARDLHVALWRKLAPAGTRSEEHTSELQPQASLVFRLLLEKQNV